MAKSTKTRKIFSKCGNNLPLNTDVLNELISYVIQFVYGDVHSSNLDSARAAKWQGQKKKSLMRLPFDSLTQHIMRANNLAYIQTHPEFKDHPSSIGHGWELANGSCRPVRHTKQSLPHSITIPAPPQLSDCLDSEDERALDFRLRFRHFFR